MVYSYSSKDSDANKANCVTAVRYLIEKCAGLSLPRVWIGDMPRTLMTMGCSVKKVSLSTMRSSDLIFLRLTTSNATQPDRQSISHLMVIVRPDHAFHCSEMRGKSVIENLANPIDVYAENLLLRIVDEPDHFLRYIDPRNVKLRKKIGNEFIPYPIPRPIGLAKKTKQGIVFRHFGGNPMSGRVDWSRHESFLMHVVCSTASQLMPMLKVTKLSKDVRERLPRLTNYAKPPQNVLAKFENESAIKADAQRLGIYYSVGKVELRLPSNEKLFENFSKYPISNRSKLPEGYFEALAEQFAKKDMTLEQIYEAINRTFDSLSLTPEVTRDLIRQIALASITSAHERLVSVTPRGMHPLSKL